jgi:hypothetical protein
MADQPADEFERFRPTNGRVTGGLGLVLCAFVAFLFVVYGAPHTAVTGIIGCLGAAMLVWLAMLRPSVAASQTHLRIRTLFETVSIPLASVDTVVVRRYLLVRSGGTKYICPAISRSLRKTIRNEFKWAGSGQMLPGGPSEERISGGRITTDVKEPGLAYPDFVEQRIVALAANERARLGIEERSEEEYELGSQVERRTAWPELVILGALAVALVVALLIGG